MATIFEQLADQATFIIDIFDGLLKVECRILTPAETEAAGLSSSMLASELLRSDPNRQGASSLIALTKDIEGKTFDELDESTIERILDYARAIKPESIVSISEKEDILLTKIVKRASQDQGSTWEHCRLVTALDQQDPKNNILWTGLLNREDRTEILKRAMAQRREAGDQLKTFR